jgi:hypothetical protein
VAYQTNHSSIPATKFAVSSMSVPAPREKPITPAEAAVISAPLS